MSMFFDTFSFLVSSNSFLSFPFSNRAVACGGRKDRAAGGGIVRRLVGACGGLRGLAAAKDQ